MVRRAFAKAFSKQLEYLMKERGIWITELSELTGISAPTISAYLRAAYVPTPESTCIIANALNCSTEELFDFEHELRDYSSDWKQSRTYPGYELNPEGKIRNAKTGKILKTRIDDKGYERVQVRKENKPYTESIHRLMGDTFFNEDEVKGKDIYHKNRNRSDNRLDNLAVSSKSETCKRGFREGKRKGRGSIRVKVNETGQEFNSIRECARALGVQETQICKCINRYAYKAGRYTFSKVK